MTMIWIFLQFLVERCKTQIFKGVWNDGSASGNHVTLVSGLRSLALVSWRSLKTGNSHPDASEAADAPRSKNIIIIFVHGSVSPLDWRVEWHYSIWRPNGISGKNRLSGTWPKAGLPDLNPRTCLCAIWMVIYKIFLWHHQRKIWTSLTSGQIAIFHEAWFQGPKPPFEVRNWRKKELMWSKYMACPVLSNRVPVICMPFDLLRISSRASRWLNGIHWCWKLVPFIFELLYTMFFLKQR